MRKCGLLPSNTRSSGRVFNAVTAPLYLRAEAVGFLPLLLLPRLFALCDKLLDILGDRGNLYVADPKPEHAVELGDGRNENPALPLSGRHDTLSTT